jgi:hypothetical protein
MQQLNRCWGLCSLCCPCQGYIITRHLPLENNLETAVRIVQALCEMAASLGVSQLEQSVSCETVASKDINMEAEEAMTLEAVTRR